MDFTYLENMSGLKNYSRKSLIKSSHLDGLKPYKLKGSFTEAAAYALTEANNSWNNMMITSAADEIRSFKEGFVSSAKEKLRDLKDKIVAWIRKVWKMFVSVMTKVYAYAKSIFTSGKRLFKNNLEEIRKGQKYYVNGKYKKKIKLFELKGDFIKKYYDGINALFELSKDNIKIDDETRFKEKLKATVRSATGTNPESNGDDSIQDVVHESAITLYEELAESAITEHTELNKKVATIFSLAYLENIINFKKNADEGYKDFKKLTDEAIKEVQKAYDDLDDDDKSGDQGKAQKDKMFRLRKLVSSSNSGHIGMMSIVKKCSKSAITVIRLYSRAGIMGPDGGKK